MDSGEVTQLFILLLLILLSAFFSSADAAFTSINKSRLKNLMENGNKRAEIISKIMDDFSKMRSAILISSTIIKLSAASIITLLVIDKKSDIPVWIAISVIILFILVFGEIIPRRASILHAEKTALSYASIIYLLMILLTPIIFLVNKFSFLVLKILHIDTSAKNNMITEDELRSFVDVSHEDGILENEERKMIYNVVDFGDSLAKDIMVSRIDMTFLDAECTYLELINIYKEVKFTRLPVYEDNIDNVIGIINVKDLLLYNPNTAFSIKEYLREPYFTYEYKKTSELMMEMKKSSINFAIVLDEYGATAGLITLEDLLEEIVGEIRDEYDSDEEDLIKQINDREYIIEGSIKLDDLNDLLNLNITSDDYDSIGGIIIELLDHLPKSGEEVTTENGIRLVAEKVDKKRIEKVHMYLPEQLLSMTELGQDEHDDAFIAETKQ